jgi:hypothetical protein
MTRQRVCLMALSWVRATSWTATWALPRSAAQPWLRGAPLTWLWRWRVARRHVGQPSFGPLDTMQRCDCALWQRIVSLRLNSHTCRHVRLRQYAGPSKLGCAVGARCVHALGFCCVGKPQTLSWRCLMPAAAVLLSCRVVWLWASATSTTQQWRLARHRWALAAALQQ